MMHYLQNDAFCGGNSVVEGFHLKFAELIFPFQENRLDFVDLIFVNFLALILKFRNIPLKLHKSAKKRDEKKRVATVQMNFTFCN